MAASSIYSSSNSSSSVTTAQSTTQYVNEEFDKILGNIETGDLCKIDEHIAVADFFLQKIENKQVQAEALSKLVECLVLMGFYDKAKSFLNRISEDIKFQNPSDDRFEFVKSMTILNCIYVISEVRDRDQIDEFFHMLTPSDPNVEFIKREIENSFNLFKYDPESLQMLGFNKVLKNAIQKIDKEKFTQFTMPGNIRVLADHLVQYDSPEKLRGFADTLSSSPERAYVFSVVKAVYLQISNQALTLRKISQVTSAVADIIKNEMIYHSIWDMFENPADLKFDDVSKAIETMDEGEQKNKIIAETVYVITILGYVHEAIKVVSRFCPSRKKVENGSKRQMAENSTTLRSVAYLFICRALLRLGDLKLATTHSQEVSHDSRETLSNEIKEANLCVAALESETGKLQRLLIHAKAAIDPQFKEFSLDIEEIYAVLMSVKSLRNMLDLAYTYNDKIKRMYVFTLIAAINKKILPTNG